MSLEGGLMFQIPMFTLHASVNEPLYPDSWNHPAYLPGGSGNIHGNLVKLSPVCDPPLR